MRETIDAPAVDLLRRTRARLCRPGAWLHESLALAVDAHGDEVRPTDPAAVSWDLKGALAAEGAQAGDPVSDRAWARLLTAGGFDRLRRIVDWHEAPERTVADVLGLLERAAGCAGAAS